MPSIATTPRHGRALRATADLLSKLRIDHAFVGSVARAAWLGGEAAGAIDVLALMASEQKNQVAMMATNRGFRVDRDEIAGSEELDLVPLSFVDTEGDVRVHVLVGSNALYGRMVAAARDGFCVAAAVPAAESFSNPAAETAAATQSQKQIRVVTPEDLALLMTMAEDEVSVRRLATLDGFNRQGYNERLVSIGLSGMVISE
jgi:hypothetical protein